MFDLSLIIDEVFVRPTEGDFDLSLLVTENN